MNINMNGLSNRKLQAIAALCLAQFCTVHRISHPSIDQLLEHLFKMLAIDNLATWDRESRKLELRGLGDPLPASLAAILPPHLANSFDRLHQFAVEVGMVDMYAGATDLPFRCFNQVVNILEQTGVPLPDVDDLFKADANDRKYEGFGEAVSAADFERVWDSYRKIKSGHVSPL
jgi:hypothetical protein